MYTPCPSPTGACESKTTMLISGRAARFLECCACGEETQYSSEYLGWGVVDRRHPGSSALVGGPEHHVPVAVDDGPRDLVEIYGASSVAGGMFWLRRNRFVGS
jgi:hypothetical protein